MTAECLTIIGHQGPIIIEGPLASNIGYCEMLFAEMNCPILVSESTTGTSQGAALLALKSSAVPGGSVPTRFNSTKDSAFRAYAEKWRKAAIS